MTIRQLRLLRAAAASTVATVFAAASHTIAGGAAPHPLLVVAVASLLVPFAAALIGARASRCRVTLTVLVSQAVFHLIFQVLGAPTGATSVSGHAHHLDLASLGPVTEAAAPDAVMIAGHAVAAALTSLLVWHGESMARAVAGWVRARLLRAAPPQRPAHSRPAPLSSRALSLLTPSLAASISRRGPPSLV